MRLPPRKKKKKKKNYGSFSPAIVYTSYPSVKQLKLYLRLALMNVLFFPLVFGWIFVDPIEKATPWKLGGVAKKDLDVG